ncbi:hypothetical protein JXB22_02775 [candidate division WOR-3 bacterium]|nr:hypothetical protein [candidate division WOR-3 bacterium]
MHRYFVLIVMIGVCMGANYVVNGDFEQAFTVGWTEYSPDSYGYFSRGTSYDPDPNYEAYGYRYGSGGQGGGYDMLHQTFDIPIIDFDFSANIKLDAWDSGSSWCGAALAVYYRNASNTVLGVTRICRISAGCPWSNTAVQHSIYASDTNWHNYSFNIEDELQNLSGVNPDAVARITIALIDTSYNC